MEGEASSVTSHPSKEETNAMVAFLAASKGTLEERARLWNAVVELIKSRPPEVVEQMEQEKGLK